MLLSELVLGCLSEAATHKTPWAAFSHICISSLKKGKLFKDISLNIDFSDLPLPPKEAGVLVQ